MEDGTFEIMADLQKKESAAMSFIEAPIYNIDEMDGRSSMISLDYSGCFCIVSSKAIDPKRPGKIYIDGKECGVPLIKAPMAMFGQLVGIFVRKYMTEYDRAYDIRYTGAYGTDGEVIPDFSFTLRTQPRIAPGEKYPEHDAVVLQAAREGMVLLKNDNNALPLTPGSTVNVFGAGSVVFRLGCLGAGKINPRYGIGVKEGIEIYSSLKLNGELYDYYTEEQNTFPPREIIQRAKAQSGTAVLFITRGSSEAHDMPKGKGGYELTDEERQLVHQVAEDFDKTVAVLNTAYPIETGYIEDAGVDAVLWTGLCGMAGGRALAELLEGSVSPSGRLPNTWAEHYRDYPSAPNFLTQDDLREMYKGVPVQYVTTVYEEGLYVGYRYFDSFQRPVAYMFGHGLSYTTFQKTVTAVRDKGCGAALDICVKNTGKVSGKETVLIYARMDGGKLEQPDKRLVAFGKTGLLNPGESEVLHFEIGEKQLKSYDEASARWLMEPGTITLLMGGSVSEAVPVHTFEVREPVIIAQVKNRLTPPINVKELSRRAPEDTWPQGVASRGFTEEETGGKLPFLRKTQEPKMAVTTGKMTDGSAELPGGTSSELPFCGSLGDVQILFSQLAKHPELLEAFVSQMDDLALARISCGGATGWGLEDTGFAGMLYKDAPLDKFGLPGFYFADGNNGVNMFQPNVGFPVSTVMAATFNEALMFEEGVCIAKEARDMNVQCLLAPAMNLQRNPLCGRHSEYFSEDPYLAGRMAGQECRGFESENVAGCLKHFIANNAETLRNCNHSIMTERTARELYLYAFEVAMDVHMPRTVMTGYNAVNGAYCSQDPQLLRGILREELGFDGFVMTDWNGYGDGNLAAALNAGINWLAPGSTDESFIAPIVKALENGTLDRGLLRQNVMELLSVVLKHQA